MNKLKEFMKRLTTCSNTERKQGNMDSKQSVVYKLPTEGTCNEENKVENLINKFENLQEKEEFPQGTREDKIKTDGVQVCVASPKEKIESEINVPDEKEAYSEIKTGRYPPFGNGTKFEKVGVNDSPRWVTTFITNKHWRTTLLNSEEKQDGSQINI